MAEIVEDGNGPKPALTVFYFNFLTRVGCIDLTQFANASTRIGQDTYAPN
jgi:hypothetical protein